MSTYIVGDLHGCYDELRLLLDKVKFDPNQDQLYLTGDLVARGNHSLRCLRFVKSLGRAAQTVLGNHDLHLLACVLGIKKTKPRDKVDEILNAPDREQLIDWLRQQPLLIHHQQHRFILTHAGISPDWDLATAICCAKEVERILSSDRYAQLLKAMYHNLPDRWNANLQGIERLCYIINVFTRMRFCHQDNRLDFDCKLPPAQAPNHLRAWYQLNNPLFKQQNILFGHWASLVDTPTPANIYALDTGCAWGNRLTLLNWEEQRYFTQQSLNKIEFN